MSEKFPQNYIYPAVIETTDTNYCLFFPDLPGCVSSGSTVEQTVELGKEAAQDYLWELERSGLLAARAFQMSKYGVFDI